jgi:hypothetical protein
MRELESRLVERGHSCDLPVEVSLTDYAKRSHEEAVQNIVRHNLIREHYRKIRAADAILVVNPDKDGLRNYIGGNTFLEMGFAYVNDKRLYVLNPLPDYVNYYDEMAGMRPVILSGDVSRIV